MTRELPLTQGKVALVDDADYEALAVFKWHAQRVSRVHGDPVWYAARTVNVRRDDGTRHTYHVLMHHEITGLPTSVEIDHWDGDGLNNQRGNIRECSGTLNNANRTRRIPNPSAPYRGVTLHRKSGRWQAQIKHLGNNAYLGLFDDPADAARAYDAAASRLFGQFARLNFPTECPRMNAYVTTLEPDPQDCDRWADDPTLLCALADQGECWGTVAHVWDVDGAPCCLCEGHADAVQSFGAGLIPAIRARTAQPATRVA